MLDCGVCIHGHSKSPAGPSDSSCSLQKRPSEGVCFGELPEGGSFLCGPPVSFMHHHMEFPKQIVREDCRHHIEMISVKPSDGNVIQIALGFQLAEGIFLRASAIVKAQDLLHGCVLVRNEHLELISVVMGDKDIKLNRFLRLLLDFTANKEKSKAGVPTFGFPRCIKVRQFIIEAPPSSSALNHLLKLSKPLKGHRDSELIAIVLKRSDLSDH